jgi:hypothetical protein
MKTQDLKPDSPEGEDSWFFSPVGFENAHRIQWYQKNPPSPFIYLRGGQELRVE